MSTAIRRIEPIAVSLPMLKPMKMAGVLIKAAKPARVSAIKTRVYFAPLSAELSAAGKATLMAALAMASIPAVNAGLQYVTGNPNASLRAFGPFSLIDAVHGLRRDDQAQAGMTQRARLRAREAHERLRANHGGRQSRFRRFNAVVDTPRRA